MLPFKWSGSSAEYLPAGRQGAAASEMFYVYVIRSEKDGRFYVGMCVNVERRIKEHNSGKTFSTKGYRPWKMFFREEYETKVEARKREKFLKAGSGKEWIKSKWSGSSAEYLPVGRQGAAASEMFYVYVIRSEKDGRFYVGMCVNVERRIKEHNSGKTFSTKGYRPWKMFFREEYETKVEARKREKFLKAGSGKEWIKSKWSGSSAE